MMDSNGILDLVIVGAGKKGSTYSFPSTRYRVFMLIFNRHLRHLRSQYIPHITSNSQYQSPGCG